MQKCKGESAESSLLELCRATQHFDDGTSKCKICGVLAEHDAFDGGHQQKFFTPLQAHGMGKITAWRGRKISLAKKKNKAFITKSPSSNKFLHISENNSVFILLLQNKAVSLLWNSGQQNNNH